MRCWDTPDNPGLSFSRFVYFLHRTKTSCAKSPLQRSIKSYIRRSSEFYSRKRFVIFARIRVTRVRNLPVQLHISNRTFFALPRLFIYMYTRIRYTHLHIHIYFIYLSNIFAQIQSPLWFPFLLFLFLSFTRFPSLVRETPVCNSHSSM